MSKFYLRDKFLIPTIVLLGILALMVISARAQDSEPRLKVYAGFSSLKPEYNDDHIRGVELGVTPKIFSYDNIRLEATGSLAGHFTAGGNNLQFLAGPQLSVDLAGKRFTPFFRGMFGTTRVFETNIFTKSIGGGVDVNLDRYFVRLFQYDRQWLGGNYPITANRYGFGGGFRF